MVFNILGVSTTGSADTFALADEEQPTDGEETPGDDAVKPDTSGINRAIQEAEAIKANTAVSADGQDVPAGTCWVTQEEMNRLEAAIAAAIAAKEAAETEEDVNEAMEALENAIAEFENARKAGKAEITVIRKPTKKQLNNRQVMWITMEKRTTQQLTMAKQPDFQ